MTFEGRSLVAEPNVYNQLNIYFPPEVYTGSLLENYFFSYSTNLHFYIKISYLSQCQCRAWEIELFLCLNLYQTVKMVFTVHKDPEVMSIPKGKNVMMEYQVL